MEVTQPITAFEACPNHAWRKVDKPDAFDIFKGTRAEAALSSMMSNHLEVVCPQYPFGSQDLATIKSDDVGERLAMSKLATKLGCMTCRFRDTLMDRIDTQTVSPEGSVHVETRFIPASQSAPPAE